MVSLLTNNLITIIAANRVLGVENMIVFELRDTGLVSNLQEQLSMMLKQQQLIDSYHPRPTQELFMQVNLLVHVTLLLHQDILLHLVAFLHCAMLHH